MKKYLKFIIIIILIILIIGGIILYINYSKSDNNNSNNTNNLDTDNGNKIEIDEDLYINNWYIYKMSVYTDEGLVSDNKLDGSGYMDFTPGYINYCVINDDCIENELKYKDGKITLEMDFLVSKGEYDLELDGDILKLSQTLEKATVVYTFKASK